MDTSGSASAVAEVAEQIAWLGAALHSGRPTSDEFGSTLRYCRPIVERENAAVTGEPEKVDQTWNIRFEVKSKSIDEDDLLNSRCWVGLFQSPIVVEGYPTVSRPKDAQGTGLDIPLHIAAQLLQARRVTTFEGRVFVKGFCAMLILSKVLEDSQTFIWHLMTNNDGGYISYRDCTHYSPFSCPNGANKALLTRLVQHGRHVIGWCQEANSLAGEYDRGACVFC